MPAKGRGKRQREQTNREVSGITPPKKKTSVAFRRRKNTVQTSISEWITDDDVTHSKDATAPRDPESVTPNDTPNTPPHSQPADMLSPILSQPRGSDERRSSSITQNPTSPISSALNLAASAASLRQDFALCEKVMTEKHQFLVSMLEGMNNTVSNIAEKLGLLESRVSKLEDNDENNQTSLGVYSRPQTKDKINWSNH